MATGNFPPNSSTNAVAVDFANVDNSGAGFIPTLWSDEIIAAFRANLVLGNLVTNFDHRGQKGDAIVIPKPTRNAAAVKAEHDGVTLIANNESGVTLTIDKHYDYARLLEDRAANTQALNSLREFYTEDGGYALAKQVDTDLHQQGSTLNGGSAYPVYNKAVIGGDGTTNWAQATSGNGTDITDAGIRRAIREFLDDNDVPEMDRALVIPPIAKEDLLGIARFTEQAFVGETGMSNSIRNGRIGSIYGVDVFVSSNCPSIESADSTPYRAGLLLHKSAMALVMQIGVRVQAQYKLEYLADLLVVDALYGVGEMRDDAGVAIIVPSA